MTRHTIDLLPVGSLFDISMHGDVAIVIGSDLSSVTIVRIVTLVWASRALQIDIDTIPIEQVRAYWRYKWAVRP